MQLFCSAPLKKGRSTKDAEWKKSKGSKQKQLHEMLFMLPITDNAQDPMRADTRQRNGIPLTGTGGCKNKKKRKNSRNRTSLVAIAITHTMVDYRLCRAAWHGLLLIIPRCVIIDFSLTLRGRQSAGEKKIKTGGKKTCKRLRVAKRGPRMWMCGPHFELRQAAGPRPDPVGRLAAGKTPSRLSPLWQLVGGVCAYLLINILHFDAWG